MEVFDGPNKDELENIRKKLIEKGYTDSIQQQEVQETPKQIFTREQKKQRLREWNNNPIVKANHIKAYDDRYIKFLWWLLFLLALIVLIFAYRTFYPDNFRDVIQQTIPVFNNFTILPPPQEITCGDCGECICNQTCPDIKIYYNSTE